GGPIINSKNEVVGLVQWGSKTSTFAVDIPGLAKGDPSVLCYGAVAGLVATICDRRTGPGTVFKVDGPPAVCGNRAADPPFFVCPPLVTECWLSSANSADKSLEVQQVYDTNTSGVYFMQQLAYHAGDGSTATIDLQSPNGTTTTLF